MTAPEPQDGSSRVLLTALVASLLLGLAAQTASAVEIGGYLGGGVGGRLRGPLAEVNANHGVEGSDISYRVFGGVDLGRYVAVEAAYFRAGEQRLSPALDFGFAVDFDGYAAAVLGKLPLGRFAAFGKIGALHWKEAGEVITLIPVRRDYSRESESLLLGAGVSFDLHPRLALRGEWEHFEVSGSARDQAWLSAAVRFP